MKKVFILSIAIIALSCNQNTKTMQPEETKPDSNTQKAGSFDWLNGNWKRLNDKDGKTTFENWEKVGATEYSGVGFTMLKNDTISQEKMSLIEKEGKWSLLVKTPDERETTEFKMTEFTHNKFICINDSIDFPKRIEYWADSGKLKAKISNEETNISFEFEKTK